MPVAIVTGAARGIGAATAQALHADGCDLVLVDRCADDPRLGYAFATELDLRAVAEPLGAQIVVGDASDRAVAEQAVTEATDTFGGLDIVVCAAGAMAGGEPAWLTSDASWQAMIEANLMATVEVARAAIPAMLERPVPRSGRFIAVSSSITNKATPLLGAYAATKAAVQSWVGSLAADLGGTGVTANVIQPGSTRTDLLEYSASLYSLASPDEFAVHHLDEQLIEPEETAAAIAWLCSPASGAMTGAVVPVDRGMTAR